MASVLNSFDILEPEQQGKQQEAQAGASKNKKNRKKANKQVPNANGDEPTAHPPNGNGQQQHAAPAAPAPAAPAPAKKPAAPHAAAQQAAVPEAWERAAREARAPDSKRALWRDWLAMADSSAKPRFKGSSGALLDFRTAMLECRALELSIEGILLLGPSVDAQLEGLLAQLLARFLCFEGDANGPASLASTLVHLSSLLAEEGPDTRGAACRAVQGLIATLRQTSFSKAASPEPQASGGSGNQAVRDWVSRMSGIDKQIEQQQATLQKMASAGRGAVTRDIATSARAIFTLLEEKASLLHPSHLPSASGSQPPSAATKQALANLADFEALVSSRLRDTSGRGGRGGKAGAQGGGPTLSGFKREEMLLAQQAEAVASQIRALEAQLRSLYSQQAEIADKSALLHEQQANTFDTVGGKGKGKGNQAPGGGGSLSAAHLQQELDAIKALGTWAGPTQLHGSSLEQVTSVQARAAGLPLQLMHAGQYYLEAALSALADVPGKVSFCRQRLSHAERLIKLGAKAQDQEKLRQEAEKLLDDSLKGADELLRSSVQVVAELAQHSQTVLQQMPDHTGEATAVLQRAEQLGADIHALYAQVQASLNPSSAPPPPAPQHQQHQPPRTPIQPTTPQPTMAPHPPPLAQQPPPMPMQYAEPQALHQPPCPPPQPQPQPQLQPPQPQQQPQQQQGLPQRPNQGRRGKGAAASAASAANNGGSTPPQQHQQQNDVHAAPHGFTFSSPRTPGTAPRFTPAAAPAVVPPPTPGSSDSASPAMQQGPAPVTPAPVPVTAPVVPHDHMHAPPPNSPPILVDTFAQPSAFAPFYPPPPPSVSPEVLAANGGFEPAAPPVPPPAPSPSATSAAARAAASAAASRPAAPARPAAKPQSSGGSGAFKAAQEMLAAANSRQSASKPAAANGTQPRKPPVAPPPVAAPAASADGNVAQPAAPPKPPAQPPRSWAKPVAMEAPPLSDEPTPAEAARLAAEKEGKAGTQDSQGASKGAGKKRAPRA